MIERYALRYSDGSYNVLSADADERAAELNRSHDDDSTAPEIVRVRLEIIESVSQWKPKNAERKSCPHCNH
jgi:protein-arginine kinase activator protein McsA